MAMVTRDKAEEFERKMSEYLGTLPNNWELKLLEPDMQGVLVETE
jgi:homoserine kinase